VPRPAPAPARARPDNGGGSPERLEGLTR
jgi:hypothetical protein